MKDYTSNFSMEWRIHRDTQLDSKNGTGESEKTLVAKTGFDLGKMRGKLALDVGCGAGRFSEIMAKYGARVVAVDLSEAVYSVGRNVPEAQVVRADIMALPFAENTFDYIFSIGVLHHTPDTEKAFKMLPRLLKQGGELAVWVYSDEDLGMTVYNRISECYRMVTTRLPLKVLYRLCYLAIPLYYLKKIPILGQVLTVLMPSSTHKGWRWMVLDTFDWYSPKYQWKHTYSEVERWFRDAGLTDVAKLKIPVAVRGIKQ